LIGETEGSAAAVVVVVVVIAAVWVVTSRSMTSQYD
jgi:hypothetical protein